ncbi:MAG: DUF655 domain-containing protein [Candidatus Micrarchaeota archaeon]|nr:DUF655 domain-containing protein [Candidatus Micrarchaeota archaeon]
MEDYGIALDYLPHGKSDDRLKQPIAYVLGTKEFTLLEVVIKRNVTINPYEKLYIGKDVQKRDKVEKIKGRVDYEHLTSNAKDSLLSAIKLVLNERKEDVINFYNNTKPLNIRMHQLELLSGIGKKHLEEFLTERENRKFDSIEDLKSRLPNFPDPINCLAHRVLTELSDKNQRYHFFVKPLNQLPPNYNPYFNKKR